MKLIKRLKIFIFTLAIASGICLSIFLAGAIVYFGIIFPILTSFVWWIKALWITSAICTTVAAGFAVFISNDGLDDVVDDPKPKEKKHKYIEIGL